MWGLSPAPKQADASAFGEGKYGPPNKVPTASDEARALKAALLLVAHCETPRIRLEAVATRRKRHSMWRVRLGHL